MPELPEVETVVRGLRTALVGRKIEAVWTDWPNIIEGASPRQLADRVQGQTIQAVARRAKFILIELEHATLVVHLRMSGRLYVAADEDEYDADRWLHFYLQLDNGTQLRFSEVRKFGRVYLPDDIDAFTGQLGPEPLDERFTLEQFRERVAGRTRIVKPLLLDQTFIAGIGNIYADEALHRAGIHPQRRADDLTGDEITRLYGAIREALVDGIKYEGASVTWYRKADGTPGESQNHFRVYGRDGEPCPVCGATIQKIRVGQRGTHFCPQCQPAPVTAT